MVINTVSFLPLRHFDPAPFPLLGTIVALLSHPAGEHDPYASIAHDTSIDDAAQTIKDKLPID